MEMRVSLAERYSLSGKYHTKGKKIVLSEKPHGGDFFNYRFMVVPREINVLYFGICAYIWNCTNVFENFFLSSHAL